MKHICKAIGYCGIAAIFFVASGPVQAKSLNGAEIKALLSGKSFSFTGPYNGTSRYSAGGTVSYRLTTGRSNTGKWWIKGNRYCTKYRKRRPKTKCYSLRAVGNDTYKATGGYTMKPR